MKEIQSVVPSWNGKRPASQKVLSSVKQFDLVPRVGLEPTRIAPADFKSAASANSATPAL